MRRPKGAAAILRRLEEGDFLHTHSPRCGGGHFWHGYGKTAAPLSPEAIRWLLAEGLAVTRKPESTCCEYHVVLS